MCVGGGVDKIKGFGEREREKKEKERRKRGVREKYLF